MSRRLLSWVLAVIVVAGATTTIVAGLVLGSPVSHLLKVKPGPVDRQAPLAVQLDQVLGSAEAPGTVLTAQVRDVETGQVLYSLAPDRPVAPASNLKLFTSAAALSLLGPDFRFRTTLAYSGTRTGSTIVGDLYVRGEGDPTLTQRRIDAIAADVARAGITTVTGRLVGDDSAFDRGRRAPGWPPEGDPSVDVAAVSALTVASTDVFDTDGVAVTVTPGATAGAPALVRQNPLNSWLSVENSAVTGAVGSRADVNVHRIPGSRRIVVQGSVPLGGLAVVRLVPVDEPAALAASAFRTSLAAHHVAVAGAVTVGVTPPSARTVATATSIPLAELLVPWLKVSDNAHSELVTKAMGRAAAGGVGSWANGLPQVVHALGDLGVPTRGLTVLDGSGLSTDDAVTTSQVTTLLLAARRQPWFAAWYAALPVAGAPGELVGGTLADRFVGTSAQGRVHAKTGTLAAVTALSGYALTADGRQLAFSIIGNSRFDLTAVVERAVVTLAGSMSSVSPRRA